MSLRRVRKLNISSSSYFEKNFFDKVIDNKKLK